MPTLTTLLTEANRMEELYAVQLLDTSSEPDFDNLAQLASEICDVPAALISFVHHDQICFKSRVGFDDAQALRIQSFCRQTVADVTPTVVEDAAADPRFQHDEFVLTPDGIRFFVSVPLVLASGFSVGCLCVMDYKPRTLSNKQLSSLQRLAGQVLALIEAKRAQLRLLAQERNRLVSEQRLDFALAAADIGDWDMDLRTNVAHRSLLHDQCFGYTDPVPVWGYDTFLAHVSDEDRARVDACYQQAMAGLGAYDVEFRVVWPDQSVHWLWSKGRFYFDDHGKPYRVAGIQVDITERKKIEEDLRESESRWRFAIEGAGDGLWDWNMQSDVAFYSLRYKEMLGYADADIGTTPDEWTKRIHPEDAPGVFSAIQPYMDGKQGSATVEFRMLRKDGLWQWILGRGMVMERDAQGKPLRMIGTNTDITERKLAEMALRSSQARLIDAQAVTKTGSWETDLSSLRVVWSAQTYTIFGVDPSTFQASHPAFLDFIHPQDREILDEAFRKSFESTAPNTIEHRIVTTTGITKWVEECWRIERDDQGNPLRAVGTCQDITERKLAAEALQVTQAILARTEEIGKLGGWEVDLNTMQQTWTKVVYDIHEVDFTGQPTVEQGISFYTPESRPIIEQAVQRAIEHGEPFDLELEIITAKGNLRAVHTIGRHDPVRDKIVGFFQDITERKRVEAALLASNAQLQLLETCVSRLNDIVVITEAEPLDQPGPRIVFVNDAFVRRTGYSREEVIGQTPRLLQGAKTQRQELDRIRAAMQRWEPVRSELINYTKAGDEFWLELDIVPVADPTGWYTHWVAIERDITQRKLADIALNESEMRHRSMFENNPHPMWVYDCETLTFLSVNDATVAQYGYSREEFQHMSLRDLLPVEDLPKLDARLAIDLQSRVATAQVWTNLCKDSTRIQVEVSAHAIDFQGRPARLVLSHDITERKRAEKSLQQAATVFSHTREGITITGTDGTILDVNEAFTRITGYSREDAIGQNPRILSSGRQSAEFYKELWGDLTAQGHWSGEIWNRRKDGEVYAELLSISAIRDEQGVTQQYVAMFSDITAIKAHQSQLEHMAHFDALTNLPNRFLLADRLHQTMAQAQRRQQQLAVVYLDLDGFKAINDQYGHETGDQVLIVLAKRFKEALREGDTLARISGDEFVTVQADLEDTSASLPLINRLQAAAELPVALGELSLSLSASLGVTFYPQAQDIDGDQLLRQAGQAMYQAKVAGKNRYCMFDAAQDSNVRKQHERLARIRLALERQEFVLYYQPKVNMRTGKVIGAEALIRWQHPEDGLLAPAAFLPAIEDHPLAVDVGEWVIDTAMRQMEVWHAAGLDLPVSVNIGARQLLQDDFVERLQVILANHPQVHPGCIELEVLETSALEDVAQASQVIEDCAGMGVHFALDDFGTGYSSLTYLKRLRVAMLKIDQSFVRDMLDDPDDLAILQGIIGLAAAFNREVIAEGVETVAHGTALLQLGCELAQGYGIARPMPAEKLPTWAATWQPDAAWGAVMNHGEVSR